MTGYVEINGVKIPASTAYRARTVLIKSLRAICAALNGGRYTVRRGPIDYSTWDWDVEPYAISILAADFPIRINPGAAGTPFAHTGAFVVELTTRITHEGEIEELNDAVLDTFAVDAETLVNRLLAARNDQGDPVIFRVHGEIRGQEMVGQDFAIQGLEVSFTVDY